MEPDNLDRRRHSLAHLLAAAVKELYPDAKATIGPAIENGFYYDFDFSSPISEADLPKIEKKMKEILPSWKSFEGKEVSFKEAREYWKDNEYKIELINELEEKQEKITFYTSGNFIDLCRGGHIENPSKEIDKNSFKLSRIAGAYWRGDEKNKMLTRIYGLAFESKEKLEEYITLQEEAKKRDHKKLGPQLGLFFLTDTAPGMPYWLPKGTIIINELLNFWREEHKKRGYLETITPLLNKKQLYETSGHWDHYKDNMFICDMGDNEVYCLKPMNCPNAMTIFQQTTHSYRDLPLRLSDCDALHRHEKSGELSGLLRVQKFEQDDAHIFVSEDQIASEYQNILEIAKLFYGIFDIKFKIRLGTRPDDFMGDIETWNQAEKDLEEILKKENIDYYMGPGEGAFYGPKLDIMMNDVMGREWQTGTIQLDFQLPRKFDLKYTDKNGAVKTPVVIHRVIYGSLERFVGILIEHYSGNFPLWLSPVQVKVIPVRESHNDYTQEVYKLLIENNIRAEVDLADENLGKKVREAKNQKIPYWIVIGDKEVESGNLILESREGLKTEALSTEKLLELLQKQIKEKN